MVKKYEFTGETKAVNGRILRRIRRLSDGEIGGWIEHEQNLSHEGVCWVADDASVCADARVYEDALVCDCAVVYDNASVYGLAVVCEHAAVYGSSRVFGSARIKGRTRARGRSRIGGSAIVTGDACVYRDAYLIAGTWSAGHVFHQATANDATAISPLPTYDVVTAALRHVLDLPHDDATPLNVMLAAAKRLRVSRVTVDLPYLHDRLGEADQQVTVGGYLTELYWPQYKLRWLVRSGTCCNDSGDVFSTTAALELEIARQELTNKGA
jgi:hypothetical protein